MSVGLTQVNFTVLLLSITAVSCEATDVIAVGVVLGVEKGVTVLLESECREQSVKATRKTKGSHDNNLKRVRCLM